MPEFEKTASRFLVLGPLYVGVLLLLGIKTEDMRLVVLVALCPLLVVALSEFISRLGSKLYDQVFTRLIPRLNIYDRIFDDPVTRGFFPVATWSYYGVYVFGLWIVIGTGAFFAARHLDSFGLWVAFILIALPALFGAFFIFRGVHSQFLAKRWRRAADKMGLDIDVDPDSSAPRMRGEYLERPVDVTIEEEANSHYTCVSAELGEASHGIEIASSNSLYFRPHEGTPVGDTEPGAPEFRIYGISKDAAQQLATSELLQQLQILEWQTEEVRIGPETAYVRQRGATLDTTELVYLTSTIAEIADMIDEVQTSLDQPAT